MLLRSSLAAHIHTNNRFIFSRYPGIFHPLLLRCLSKRREVVLELQWFHEQQDLWFAPPWMPPPPASHQPSNDQSQTFQGYATPQLTCQEIQFSPPTSTHRSANPLFAHKQPAFKCCPLGCFVYCRSFAAKKRRNCLFSFCTRVSSYNQRKNCPDCLPTDYLRINIVLLSVVPWAALCTAAPSQPKNRMALQGLFPLFLGI